MEKIKQVLYSFLVVPHGGRPDAKDGRAGPSRGTVRAGPAPASRRRSPSFR